LLSPDRKSGARKPARIIGDKQAGVNRRKQRGIKVAVENEGLLTLAAVFAVVLPGC